MEHIILEESFDPPLTDEEHNRLAVLLDPCLERYGARWLQSYLSRDRRRMICIFEAADAEAVRSAYRAANAGFDRAWPAEVFTNKQTVPQTVP